MILEIVAEALRERHAGGMPPSAKQEAVAANARSFTGQYLKETLAKAPRASALTLTAKPKRARKVKDAEADQSYLIPAK